MKNYHNPEQNCQLLKKGWQFVKTQKFKNAEGCTCLASQNTYNKLIVFPRTQYEDVVKCFGANINTVFFSAPSQEAKT